MFSFSNLKIVFLLTLTLFIVSSCATKVGKKLQLSAESYYFEFSEPVAIRKSFLPNGKYRCYYKDDEGCYFEAPATLKENMMFNRSKTGGIYILDSNPLKAYIFSQDKHPAYGYVHGAGLVTFGGSGYYVVDDPLPNDIALLIKIQKGNIK